MISRALWLFRRNNVYSRDRASCEWLYAIAQVSKRDFGVAIANSSSQATAALTITMPLL